MYDNYTQQIRAGKSISIDDAALQNVQIQSGKRPTLQMPNGMQMGGE